MKEYLKQSNIELLDWQVDLVMKCLSGNIDDRFETCEKLANYIKSKLF